MARAAYLPTYLPTCPVGEHGVVERGRVVVPVGTEEARQALQPSVPVVMLVPVIMVMPVVVRVTVPGRVRCHCSLAGSEFWTGATVTLEVHRASTLPHRQ